MDNKGILIGAEGDSLVAEVPAGVVCYRGQVVHIPLGKSVISGEVVEFKNGRASIQSYAGSEDLFQGLSVEFLDKRLSARLGPGLLGNVFTGLQQPFDCFGQFIDAKKIVEPLDLEKRWDFVPVVKKDQILRPGDVVGEVDEGPLKHKILIPFAFSPKKKYRVVRTTQGSHKINDVVLVLNDGKQDIDVTMCHDWPIRESVPSYCYSGIKQSSKQLRFNLRTTDCIFRVQEGQVSSIMGDFGVGKTTFLVKLMTSGAADVFTVILTGERAKEVAETIKEDLANAVTSEGKPLMGQTVIIANSSKMNMSSRIASIRMGTTVGMYYAMMGYRVISFIDSFTRLAQAELEFSQVLEKFMGKGGYPPEMAVNIPAFFSRAGVYNLLDKKSEGSHTLLTTISPPAGDAGDPIVEGIRSVVSGSYFELLRTRAAKGHYPASEPSVCKTFNMTPEGSEISIAYDKGKQSFERSEKLGKENVSYHQLIESSRYQIINLGFFTQDFRHKIDGKPPQERVDKQFDVALSVARWLPSEANMSRERLDKVTEQLVKLSIRLRYDEDAEQLLQDIESLLLEGAGKDE